MDQYRALLEEAGIDLPERRMNRLANKVAQEVQLRIGNEIADSLTDEDFEEFERILVDASERQVRWLNEHYPEYATVVASETEKVRKELLKAKDPAVLIKLWHQTKI